TFEDFFEVHAMEDAHSFHIKLFDALLHGGVYIATHIHVEDDGFKRSLLRIETEGRHRLLIEVLKIILNASITVESAEVDTQRENVPLPEKQLHSLERLAEAHARMHLRQEVVREDVLAALHALSVSLISSQKLGARESVRLSLKSLNDYLLFANVLQ
nr:ACT domain-containing protein ACR12 [Tanacetum cinerariifolium]